MKEGEEAACCPPEGSVENFLAALYMLSRNEQKSHLNAVKHALSSQLSAIHEHRQAAGPGSKLASRQICCRFSGSNFWKSPNRVRLSRSSLPRTMTKSGSS
eukprot:5247841-Amphidinium_carterae.1